MHCLINKIIKDELLKSLFSFMQNYFRLIRLKQTNSFRYSNIAPYNIHLVKISILHQIINQLWYSQSSSSVCMNES